VRDECVRLGSNKTIEEVVGYVLGKRKSLKLIKMNFHWRDTKGGRNSLGGCSIKVKIN
jgi:hypothetical protein